MFSNSAGEDLCPLAYAWDYDILVMTSWTYTMEPRILVWNSYSNAKSGYFPIGMIASNEVGLSARVEYTLIVDPTCGT